MRAAIICLVLFCSPFAAADSALTTLITTMTHVPVERYFEGRVEAVAQSTASAQTTGRVSAIHYDVGDAVPAGASIITLVGVEQKESLNRAQAALNEAKAQRQAAAANFTRVKSLYERKLLSKANYDDALAQINSADARLASAEAAKVQAEQQLSYTDVKAAFAGVVSARHVEIGEAVSPGVPLMTGFDPQRMRVLVDLPQTLISAVQADTLRVQGEQPLIPEKVTIFPVADPHSGAVRVRLDMPASSPDALYPGKLVKVALASATREVLYLPRSALVFRGEIAAVFVLQKDTPVLRQVRLGRSTTSGIEVLAGLRAGEQVATDPVAAGKRAVELSRQQ